jgi:lipoate-protein ligase A
MLHVYRDPPLDGPTNMARDEHLLNCSAVRPAAVRIYSWNPPTISLGCFQRFVRTADLPQDVRDLAIVRRLTGGGAILHDREVTYCLVMDDSVAVARESPPEAYRMVHECWRGALAASGVVTELAPDSFPMPSPRSGPFFCFEKPGRTDLLLNGAKLLGSSQRRTGGRVLQQGSLLLGRRFASHPGGHLNDPAAETVAAWTDAFLGRLAEQLGLTPRESDWTSDQLADIARRRVRYADDAWTRRR